MQKVHGATSGHKPIAAAIPTWPFIGIPAIKLFINPKHHMVEASFSYVGACFSREGYTTKHTIPG